MALRNADDIVVTGVGMVSPVGSTAAQTFASIRSGIRRMRELPEIYCCLPEDPRFDDAEPLVGSAISHLDAKRRRTECASEWLGLLAGRAFADLLESSRLEAGVLKRLGLFLAIPTAAALPVVPADVATHLHNHAEVDELGHVQIVPGERPTALALAEAAASLLRERKIDFAAVGAVDSYLFPERLSVLDKGWRLLSTRNPDGFQPGEAAAFVLLERRATCERRGVPALATLRGSAQARFEKEKGLPNRGVEVASTLERLLAAESGHAPLIVCDLNGESARTKEWGHALSRLGRRLGEGLALEHPASVLGDVGAATGAVLLATAVRYLATKHAARPGALIWAGADDGERRALHLARS